MSVSDTCKNLLTERNCDCCKFKEEDFKIERTKSFPVKIPQFHQLLLIEKSKDFIIVQAKAFIKDNFIYICADDYDCKSKYLLHYHYPLCMQSNQTIPEEYTCELFTPIK